MAAHEPIIFLTGHGDIAMTVQAMKAGAGDFLTKPVRDQTLLDAVTAAIEKDISQRTAARLVKQHVDRYAKLTPREREVLREVVKGRLNKQIAFDLGISEVTVKLHRGSVTKKMQAASVGQPHSHLGTAAFGASTGEVSLRPKDGYNPAGSEPDAGVAIRPR